MVWRRDGLVVLVGLATMACGPSQQRALPPQATASVEPDDPALCIANARYDRMLGCLARKEYAPPTLFAAQSTEQLQAMSEETRGLEKFRSLVMLSRRQSGAQRLATLGRAHAVLEAFAPDGASFSAETTDLAGEVEDGLVAADMDTTWPDGDARRCAAATMEELWQLGPQGDGRMQRLIASSDTFFRRVNQQVFPHHSRYWSVVARARLGLVQFRIVEALEPCTEENVVLFGPKELQELERLKRIGDETEPKAYVERVKVEFRDRKRVLLEAFEKAAFQTLLEALALARVVGGTHEVLVRAAKAAAELRGLMGEKRTRQLLWILDDPTDPRAKRSLAPMIDILAPTAN